MILSIALVSSCGGLDDGLLENPVGSRAIVEISKDSLAVSDETDNGEAWMEVTVDGSVNRYDFTLQVPSN